MAGSGCATQASVRLVSLRPRRSWSPGYDWLPTPRTASNGNVFCVRPADGHAHIGHLSPMHVWSAGLGSTGVIQGRLARAGTVVAARPHVVLPISLEPPPLQRTTFHQRNRAVVGAWVPVAGSVGMSSGGLPYPGACWQPNPATPLVAGAH